MNRQTLWHVPILAGLLLGLAMGLIYTWLIAPVQYYNTAPDRLRAGLKEEYILLICETYAADGDWPAAQERLAQLGDPDIAATILELAERAIEQGKPVSAIRYLASVAGRLGVSSPAVVHFMPTRPPTPSPAPETILATFTPTLPPLPTVTFTPPPPAPPTFTPPPTSTPRWRYQLLAQQKICDYDRSEPLLQVIVRDAEGNDVSGAEVVITWGTESTHLFTGFKPELGRGYADLIIEPEVSYAVHLAAGSEEASGIQATPCNSSAGPRLLSTRLVFEEIE